MGRWLAEANWSRCSAEGIAIVGGEAYLGKNCALLLVAVLSEELCHPLAQSDEMEAGFQLTPWLSWVANSVVHYPQSAPERADNVVYFLELDNGQSALRDLLMSLK